MYKERQKMKINTTNFRYCDSLHPSVNFDLSKKEEENVLFLHL